jgi:cytochrome c-type biogenesis protein CcmH/NrfF
MSKQKCACGWILPMQWGIHVDFGDDQEEVIELPDGAEDETDEMRLTVELRCPQCSVMHVVVPDDVVHHELGKDAVN